MRLIKIYTQASLIGLAIAIAACTSDKALNSKTGDAIQATRQVSQSSLDRVRGGAMGQNQNGMGGEMGGGMGPNPNGMGDGMGSSNPLPIDMSPLTSTDQSARCDQITASVKAAGFSDSVEVNCGGGNAYLIANTVPDHDVLTGIINTNEQTVVPAQGFTQIVQLSPELTNIALTRDASLAVAVNGVPIYDYTGGGEMDQHMLAQHQTRTDTLLTHQLDICGGHAGRADDYHYHVTPNCMIDMMDNKDQPDAIIGWAFDGFPIFRDTNPDGTAIAQGELDVCNGKVDNQYGYRYHTSESAPYIIQCLMGKVEDIRSFPRITPAKAKDDPSQQKQHGVPPKNGVDNLTFTTLADGTKSLDYAYAGKPYYIRYTHSDAPGCFKFTQRTVTQGGALVEGEYCR